MVTITTMKTMEPVSAILEEVATVKAVIIVAQTMTKPIQVQVHSLIHRTRDSDKER
jgi:flavorubredoxin